MISTVFGLHPFGAGKLKLPKSTYTAYIFHDFPVMCKPNPGKTFSTAYNLTVFYGFCKPYRV